MRMSIIVQQVQSGTSRSHGQGVTGQCSRLIDRPKRRQLLHDMLRPTVGAHR